MSKGSLLSNQETDMRINLLSVAAITTTLLAALVRAPAARADDDRPHKLGDHPAVVVQRLHKVAGYDYASKFYPHPAWLRLYATQPNEGAALAATADAAPGSRPGPA